jgi:hypothetical protein
MSVLLGATNILYGETTTITVNDLNNISIQPSEYVLNIETTLTGIIATVKPINTTIFYIKGLNNLNEEININQTIYVNVVCEQNSIIIDYGSSVQLTANGSSTYKWLPNVNIENNINNIQSIIVSPKKDIIYSVLGTDIFNTVSYYYVNIKVNSNLIFTSTINNEIITNNENISILSGNRLILSVEYYLKTLENPFNLNYQYNDIYNSNDAYDPNDINNRMVNNNITNINNIKYTWKLSLFSKLPDNCVHLLYGNSIIIHPYYNKEYEVTAYDSNNKIITKGYVKINVIPKPPNIIDIDIIPLVLYNNVIMRNEKELTKQLIINKKLSKKIINFYYTTLQTSYKMEFTNKNGISVKIPWFTYYQEVNVINEMILTFEQQWKFFKFINNNQKKNGKTMSNFAFLINIVNKIYLEYPQKIYVTPL